MEQFLSEHAFIALFGLSFLAATLVPLGSEWLLVMLIVRGVSAPAVVLTATAGNFLGACTTYFIGRWGSDFLIRRLLRIDAAKALRAERLYGKWGVWSLTLSWLPLIGDPLCLAAGIFKTHFLPFSVLVLVGKCLRYGFVVWVTLSTLVN